MDEKIQVTDENLRHGSSRHFFEKLMMIEKEQNRLSKMREKIIEELSRRNTEGSFW